MVLVPANQTVVVKGLKSYVDERKINEFVEKLGCKTSLPSRPTADKHGQSGEKQAFLNYRSSSDARAALSKISSLNKRETADRKLLEIFKDDVVRCFLKSEGPSKAKVQKGQHQAKETSDSEDSSGDEGQKLVDALVQKLKAAPSGSLQGSIVGNMIRKKTAWRREVDDAGGVKSWCEDNAGKVAFVNDGAGGRVILDTVKITLSAGDFVKLAASTPRLNRGSVPAWGVGIVKSVNVNVCVIDFPEQSSWRGSVLHVVKASKSDSMLADEFEPTDSLYDKHAFVRKKRTNVFEFTGNASNSRRMFEKEYGFVRGKQELKKTAGTSHFYFELEIIRHNNAETGIGIGLCDDTFVAGKMLGWEPGSIGYHSDDGGLFFRSGQGASFGPTASVGDKMGCGVLCGDLSNSCYFTHNGRVIGRILLSKKTDEGSHFQFYPAVSASAPSVVEINLSATPPCDDTVVGCVLTTSKWQAKYDDTSNKWKPVSRQGPPSDNGDVPVTFGGYKDVVWVPQRRLRQAIGSDAGTEDHEMASFELACLMADDGDVIKVNDVGVHQLTQKMVIRKKIRIQGNMAQAGYLGGRKPVISVSKGFVFEIRSDVSIQNICIKSTGGDKSDGFANGGAAGVVLVSGTLEISSCDVQSINGTGVAVADEKKPAVLNISDCSVGPCGRHGLIVNGNGGHKISNVRIMDCDETGLGTNPTVDSITIEQCEISECKNGMKLIEPSDVIFKDTSVSDCSSIGIDVSGVKSITSGTPAVSFEGCSIKGCPRGLVAQQEVTVKWGASNSISNCKTATQATLSAKVEQDSPTSPKDNSSVSKKSSSEGYSQVGSEEDNFARYFRLLHHTATNVLLAIFKASFKKSAGKEWLPECGKEVYTALPRESVSKLGKESRVSLESGATDTWDITLLSSLLLFSPGYLKATPEEELCTTIRTHRNQLNHNPPTFKCDSCQGKCSCGLGQPIMAKADFDTKWQELSSVISKLTASVLAREEHQKFVSQVEEMRTHKFMVSEDREMRDLFNSELKSVTARMSKIEEKAVTKSFLGKALENFQSLFRSNGTIDKDKLPQQVVLSNDKTYTLVKKAGAGGMGTVFVAFAQDTEEQVAFKICDGGDHARAEREAEVLRRLTKIENHENVVRFIDSAIHNSHYVIIMELVKGVSLEEWLEKRGRESCKWQESKEIMLGIASGMAEVHKIEISHRDLKPGNVMFDEASGKVVIVDFGLSKQSNANQTMTVAGSAGFGTKPYMSPEQVDPEYGEVYLPSDVWAIGIIWYEVLAGITPFEPIIGNDSKIWAASSQDKRASLKITQTTLRHESKMIEKICGEQPRDWERLEEGVPPPIIEVIDKCLQHKQAERYQTAGELLEHLGDVFARLSGSKSDVSQPDGESSVKPFADWTVEEVCQLLVKCGFSEQAGMCRDEGVDGKTWASLSPEELKADLGMSTLKLKRFKAEVGQ